MIKYFLGYPSNNILDIVRDIRTIFSDFNENFLELSVDTNIFKTHVIYKEGKLIYYKYDGNLSIEEKLSFNYELDQSINFSITGNTSFDKDKYIELYSLYLKNTEILQNTLPIKTYHNEELLFKVYKLFYGINPDFCDKNINVKIQTMISILTQFNICLNYPLSVYNRGKMPQNINLTYLVHNLRGLGEVDVEKLNTFKLTYPYESEIEKIGKIVRKCDIDMITLSKLIHAGNYDLSEKSDKEYLNHMTNCSELEIKDSIKLVKTINKKLSR